MNGELGSMLRSVRTRERRRLDRIARQTKIPERYLRALEEERFDQLPGAFYVRSYLRQYADALGLDGTALVEEYGELLPAAETEARLREPLERDAPARRRRLAYGLAIAGAAAGLLFALRPERAPEPRLATTIPARPPASDMRARPPAPIPPVSPWVSLLAARGDCWLLVRDGSERGQILYEGTLHLGASIRFRRSPLWVRLGAPWNVDLLLDGRPYGVLARVSRPANVVITRSGVRRASRP